MKKFISFVLSICMLFSCFILAPDTYSVQVHAATVDNATTSSIDYGLVDNVQYGQILHCWNWSFDNIRKNMPLIASQGFTAIQTSPIQSSKESTRESWSSVQNSAWVYYQPISFNIEQNSWNALGTKEQFEAMCDEAHKYGVKVIVDTVFNHMANDSTENTINPQITSDLRDDPNCWYSVTWNTSNWEDRYDVTHNCLSGFPDLNTSNSKVQSYAINFLKECIDAGADGFRFDAVKHIETPADAYGTASDFWPNVLGTATYHAQQTRGITPYYYGELLGSPGGGLSVTAYTDHMSVTDNNTGNAVRDAIANGDAAGACRAYISNGASPVKSVQWNESHDTYYADNNSIWISNENMKKTWAIVGSRAEVCGLYLARPENNETTMLGDGDITAWADKEVKAINKFKNYFAGHPEYLAYSGNIVYNERGNTGVVLVNASGGSASVSVPAHRMYNGVYTDAITGNHFTVSNGTISGSIGDSGIAVVYSYPSTVEVDKESQAFRGDTLQITLGYNEATGGTYSIDGSTAKDYIDGDVISVGCGTAYGEETELLVTASGGTTTDSVIKTYKKLHPDTDLKIFFDNSTKNWSQVYAYIYNSDGDKVSSWPGTLMSYDSNRGLYYIDVPNGFETSKVVFNDGNGNQTPSSGGHLFNAYTSIYKGGYFYGYNTGISGNLYFKPSDNWLSDNARFAVYLWNDDGNAWVNFTDSNGDGIYQAELPDGTWNECIFARMNPTLLNNNWDNVWNQTGDMGLSNNNNYFVIDEGWDTSDGTWSVIDASVVGDKSDAFLSGNFNNWSETSNAFVYTDYNTAVTNVDLPAGTYTFKLIKGGEWLGNPGTINDTTSGVGWRMCKNENSNCTLVASGGTYTFTLNTETLKVTVDYEPGEVEPPSVVPTEEPSSLPSEEITQEQTVPPTAEIEKGYYIVGTINGEDCWKVDDTSTGRMLLPNPYNSGEYMLDYTFVNGDEIKVVYFDGNDITKWYNSDGDNYRIGSSKAGACTVYFRPDGNTNWSYLYFTVIPKSVIEPTVEPTEPPTQEQPSEELSSEEPSSESSNVAPTEPEKVNNISAEVGTSTVKFTWDKIDGATNYWVCQYNADTNKWPTITGTASTSIVVKNLNGSTDYQFKIIAKTSEGKILNINKADVIAVTTKLPLDVSDVAVLSNVTSAKLTWTPVDGVTKYWIYKSTEPNGPFYVYDGTTENTCTVKRMRPDTTYYYKIVSMNFENGLYCFSPLDDAQLITVKTGSAAIITTKAVENTSTTTTINWPAFENADQYWVMYSTTSADTNDRSHWTVWASTKENTYTLKFMKPNTMYYVTVCARYTDSETGKIETIDYIPAMVRTAYSDSNFITFTPVDDDTVTLSWDENIENVSKAWVGVIDNEGKEVLINSTTTNSITINYANYKSYSFVIKVVDSENRVGYLTKTNGEKFHL